MATPQIQDFFDPHTSTFSYIVHHGDGSDCAIIDSVLDFDPIAVRTSTASADKLIAYVRQHELRVQWLLETHAHADHLSAAPYLRAQLGGKIAIGEHIREVQTAFNPIFNIKADTSYFDYLFSADEVFQIGSLRAQALHVPGHTPADMAYLIEDQIAFIGDTLFMPDVGTARCDFPGGSAPMLYQSIQKLLSLAPDTRLYVCHDYPPPHRQPQYATTVAEQRSSNIHVKDGISVDTFAAMRRTRDATLSLPVLMMPAVQLNICAGNLPEAEENGVRYLKVPLNLRW